MDAQALIRSAVVELNEDPPDSERGETVASAGNKPVSQLLGNGVTEADIGKLKSAGLCTVEAVAFTPKKKLLEICGISELKADKLLREAIKVTPMGFTTAAEFLKERKELVRITTGSRELDRILGGGIETGSITEVSGEARTGKSQLAMMLAITSQLKIGEGGGDGKCVFIDTEGTFRTNRLLRIAERFGLDEETALNNIALARAYNSNHQSELLVKAAALMSETRVAMIIVDSVTNLFRTDYSGREQLLERQTHLGQFLRNLHRLVNEYGVACLITNQMVANVNNSVLGGPANAPIGGHVLAHACTTRLALKKLPGATRAMRITASPSLPEVETQFLIRTDGIGDVEEND